jgi:hypothetical protein
VIRSHILYPIELRVRRLKNCTIEDKRKGCRNGSAFGRPGGRRAIEQRRPEKQAPASFLVILADLVVQADARPAVTLRPDPLSFYPSHDIVRRFRFHLYALPEVSCCRWDTLGCDMGLRSAANRASFA